MKRIIKAIKRFLTLFVPLVTILEVATWLSHLLLQWVRGMPSSPEIVGNLAFFLIPLLFVLPTSFFLFRVLRDTRPNYCLYPVSISGIIFLIVSAIEKDRLPDIMLTANVLTASIATLLTFLDQKLGDRKASESAAGRLEEKEKTRQSLARFKTAIKRQFYVIRNVEEEDIFYELDYGNEFNQLLEYRKDYLVFQLPDGRFLVQLIRQISTEEFQEFLSRFRDEAEDDLDALGYLDRSQRDLSRMMVADSLGEVRAFAIKDSGYIPFDFSLLEKAKSVSPKEF